jgi:SagB-type dehydrogenase family enzyme
MDEIQAQLLFDLYHENSKLFPSASMDIGKRVAAFFANYAIQKKIDRSYKSYDDANPISLEFGESLSVPFDRLIFQRESVTPVNASDLFQGQPISVDDLSQILLAGYAEVRRRRVTVGDIEFSRGARTVPSGGGLYPLEVYIWNKATEEDERLIPYRFYHLNPADRTLEEIGVECPRLDFCFPESPYTKNSPSTVVVITALHRRTSIKYGERCYRFILLEAGHLMQNMLLAATAVDVPAVPIGGFYDDVLANTLRIDPRHEFPLYCLFLGR